eukprot:scaffold233228_cov21-Tisochrysis_lutea.AAC.1
MWVKSTAFREHHLVQGLPEFNAFSSPCLPLTTHASQGAGQMRALENLTSEGNISIAQPNAPLVLHHAPTPPTGIAFQGVGFVARGECLVQDVSAGLVVAAALDPQPGER